MVGIVHTINALVNPLPNRYHIVQSVDRTWLSRSRIPSSVDGFVWRAQVIRRNVKDLAFWYVATSTYPRATQLNPSRLQTEIRAGLTTWVSPPNLATASKPLTLYLSGCYGLHCERISHRLIARSVFTPYAPAQISVNASIIADSGGTCVCTLPDLCVTDPTYLACKADVRRDLITTTAAIAALASFLMGLLANLPVGMAPGLGLNAYVSPSHRPHP